MSKRHNSSFQDLSNDSIVSWYWDFGDGDTAMCKTLRIYTSCGSFNVRLVVVDIHGCNDTIENTVVVHCLPENNIIKYISWWYL